jgi:hypothetical protein
VFSITNTPTQHKSICSSNVNKPAPPNKHKTQSQSWSHLKHASNQHLHLNSYSHLNRDTQSQQERSAMVDLRGSSPSSAQHLWLPPPRRKRTLEYKPSHYEHKPKVRGTSPSRTSTNLSHYEHKAKRGEHRSPGYELQSPRVRAQAQNCEHKPRSASLLCSMATGQVSKRALPLMPTALVISVVSAPTRTAGEPVSRSWGSRIWIWDKSIYGDVRTEAKVVMARMRCGWEGTTSMGTMYTWMKIWFMPDAQSRCAFLADQVGSNKKRTNHFVDWNLKSHYARPDQSRTMMDGLSPCTRTRGTNGANPYHGNDDKHR